MWGTHAQIHRQQREMPTFKCRNVWVVSFRIHLLPYRSVIDCPWKIHVNMNRIEFKWIIYPFHSTPLHFDLCFNYLQLIFHCWIRLVLFVLECACVCVTWTCFHFDLFTRIIHNLQLFTAQAQHIVVIVIRKMLQLNIILFSYQ